MGLKLQRKVLRSGLPRYRFLATVLALYADEDGGSIFPCVATLAANLGEKRDAVLRGLKWLKEAGVLVVEQPGGGRGRATHYRMVPNALPEREGNGSVGAMVSGSENHGVNATVSAETVAFEPSATAETVAFAPSETVAPGLPVLPEYVQPTSSRRIAAGKHR